MRFISNTTIAIVVVMLIIFVFAPMGVKRTNITCDGVITERYTNSVTRHPKARLGLVFEEISPLFFWADERRRLNYSYAHINESGGVDRWMENGIPFEQYNDTFASAGIIEDGSETNRTALFYDNISGLAQLVIVQDERRVIFDGFCDLSQPAIVE